MSAPRTTLLVVSSFKRPVELPEPADDLPTHREIDAQHQHMSDDDSDRNSQERSLYMQVNDNLEQFSCCRTQLCVQGIVIVGRGCTLPSTHPPHHTLTDALTHADPQP